MDRPADVSADAWAVALHESGHALASWGQGESRFPIDSVRLLRHDDGRHSGAVSFKASYRQQGVRQELLVTAAGPMAEIVHGGGARTNPWGMKSLQRHLAVKNDWQVMMAQLDRLPVNVNVTTYFDMAVGDARRLLARQERALFALARRLLATPEVDGLRQLSAAAVYATLGSHRR